MINKGQLTGLSPTLEGRFWIRSMSMVVSNLIFYRRYWLCWCSFCVVMAASIGRYFEMPKRIIEFQKRLQPLE